MDAIRAFVQTLLPFEFLQFDFMVNALLAILLLTPLLGPVSYTHLTLPTTSRV